MKRLIILILFFFVSIYVRGQSNDWSKTRNWKIYALNNREAYFYPVDTLANFKSTALNDSTVISFLSQAHVWPKGKGGTWKGVFIASYESVEGQLTKVVISSYGGFLFDAVSHQYYELPKASRQRWNELITQNLQKVFEE